MEGKTANAIRITDLKSIKPVRETLALIEAAWATV